MMQPVVPLTFICTPCCVGRDGRNTECKWPGEDGGNAPAGYGAASQRRRGVRRTTGLRYGLGAAMIARHIWNRFPRFPLGDGRIAGVAVALHCSFVVEVVATMFGDAWSKTA